MVIQLKSVRSLYQLHQYYINWRAGYIDVIDRFNQLIRQHQTISEQFGQEICRYEKALYGFFFVCVFFFYWEWGIKALFRNYIIQFLQQSSFASINNAFRALCGVTAEQMVLQRSVHPHSAADKLVLLGHLSQVDTSTKVFCGKVNYPFKSSFLRGLPDEVS